MLLGDNEIKDYCERTGMIVPYETEKKKMGSLSYGLGQMGYDIRISGTIKRIVTNGIQVFDPAAPNGDTRLDEVEYEEEDLEGAVIGPGEFILAFTKETFNMPGNAVGLVKDKSTLARLGLAVQNTVLEPGWRGVLTVEISNHGPLRIRLREGMPIGQLLIFTGYTPSQTTYSGRYQDQQAGTPALDYVKEDQAEEPAEENEGV